MAKKEYYLANKDRIRRVTKEYNLRYKTEILKHYSNGKLACVICGFDNIYALSIDHINGNGGEHRREMRTSGSTNFYRWLKKNGFPEGYQTLCMNCQWIKRQESEELAYAIVAKAH